MSKPKKVRQQMGLEAHDDVSTAPDEVEASASSGPIEEEVETARDAIVSKAKPVLMELPLGLIEPNPAQVRSNLNDPQSVIKLKSLAQSIDRHGLQQPILVRKIETTADGAEYQIIAGERRFRAHKDVLKRETIACLVFNDKTTFKDKKRIHEVSLIENVQRENLDALDLANAMNALKVKYGYKQEELGEILGMAKPTVSRVLGILKLDIYDDFYLKDYQDGVFDEIDPEDEKGEVVIKTVREAVSLTALTEFASLTRTQDYTPEQIRALWNKIRCGKVPTDKIRELVTQAPDATPEPDKKGKGEGAEPKPEMGPQEKSAKELKKSFAAVDKALTVMDTTPVLTAHYRTKVEELIKRLQALLEK